MNKKKIGTGVIPLFNNSKSSLMYTCSYYQNDTTNQLSSQKHNNKIIFRNRTFSLEVDLEVDLLTLKMTSNSQNNSVNGCFIQNHIKGGITLVLFAEKIMLDLEIDFFTLKYGKITA